jgi:alpha-1,6-mannosyltransferase
MSATVLLSPVVHYWYFFWCLPFLAAAVLPRRFARAALAMTLVLGLLAPVDLSAHHLPFSWTIMLVGLGLALSSALV